MKIILTAETRRSAVCIFVCVYVCVCVSLYIYIYTHIYRHTHFVLGRDSSVGIATRYGLDGLGIESLWWRDFPHPSRPTLEFTQSPIQWVQDLTWG